jgi:hypothetical protein
MIPVPTQNDTFSLTASLEIRDQNDPFIYLYRITGGKLSFEKNSLDGEVFIIFFNSKVGWCKSRSIFSDCCWYFMATRHFIDFTCFTLCSFDYGFFIITLFVHSLSSLPSILLYLLLQPFTINYLPFYVLTCPNLVKLTKQVFILTR